MSRSVEQPPFLNSLSNVFLSHAKPNQEFVQRLNQAFTRQGLSVWIKSKSASRSEIEARIDAADYFILVVSPDYLATKDCRRELSYALERHKKILAVVREEVGIQTFPQLRRVGPPILFRQGDDFNKSFRILLTKLTSEFNLDAFISYSRQDTEFVEKLATAFRDKGRRIFLDRRNIYYTDEWLEAIHSGIEAADNFLFIISPDALSSKFCRDELQHAVRNNKRIVPLLVREVDQLPPPLASRKYHVFCSEVGFVKEFRKLLKTLDTDLEYVRQHTRLLNRSIEWVTTRRRKGLLLRGKELSAARRWLSQSDQKQPSPTKALRDFVNASRAAARVRIVFVACVALLLTMFGVFVLRNLSTLRRVDVARKLLASSLALRKESSDVTQQSLLLALESYRRDPSPEAYQAVSDGILSLPLVAFLLSHERATTGMCFSTDGQYIVTASLDRSVRTWDAKNGRPLWRRDFPERVTDVACSPDSRMLAVGLRNSLQVVDIANGHVTMEVSQVWRNVKTHAFDPEDKDLRSLFFSPHGRYLVTLSGGDILLNLAWQQRIWDMTDGKEVGLVAPPLGVTNKVYFTPDEKFFVTLPKAGRVVAIMETQSNRVVTTLPVDLYVGDYAVSFDGNYIATGDQKGLVTIWNFRSHRVVRTIKHDGPVNQVSFSPNGRHLATGTQNHYVHVWDLNDGHEVSRLRHLAATVELVVFSPDGRYIVSSASAANDQTITAILWRTEDGSEVARLTHEEGAEKASNLPPLDYYRFYSNLMQEVVFSPDGRFIATRGAENIVKVWAPFDDRLQLPSEPCDSPKVCRGISQNGGFVAVLDQKHLLSVRTSDNNKPIEFLRLPEKHFLVFVSNNGQIVATETSVIHNVSETELREETFLVIWSLGKKQPILIKSYKFEEFVPLYAISPDGNYLIETRADGTRQIDVTTGNILWKDGTTASTATVDASALVFNPSGRYFAYWDQREQIVAVRETATSNEIVKINNRSLTSAAAVDPAGSRLAVVEREKIIVYQTINGKEINRISALGPIRWIVFSPDGRYLAIGTYENAIQIWEAGSPREAARFRVDGLSSVTFAPNGNLMITVRNVITQLDWSPDKLLAAGCSRLTRNLNLKEWREYLGSESYHRTCQSIP